jgi:CRISPR/Cas system-associated exonuclease Cas4 (RecB family)
MIKQFEKLNTEETGLLLKAPILVSVLASSSNHEINKSEKEDAIKLAHLKTFTADPLLLEYYKEVEKDFIRVFDSVEKKYTPFNDENREALKKEIDQVNSIISKLEIEYGETLHRSLSGYAEHVKKAGRGVLENFVFPVPISGLNN